MSAGGGDPEPAPVLYGLYRFYAVRLQLHTAHELGTRLLRLAQEADDAGLTVIAHNALGVTGLYFGALPVARQHLEAGLACYTPAQRQTPAFRLGQDPGVACGVHAALTLWLLGYPAHALARLHATLAVAQALAHPFSLAYARRWAAFVYQFRRDVQAVHEQADATLTLATERGFTQWAAVGTIFRGWALAMQGQGEEGRPRSSRGSPPGGPRGPR